MIDIHRARGWEAGAAESLWTDTFGDEAAFQEEFYRLCTPEWPLVLTRDGALCAMLAGMLELPLVLADGRRLRAGYGYALATRPDCRGQGFGAMLMDAMAELARGHGLDCVISVPAQPSLFRYFAGCGYRAGFYRGEKTVAPGAAPAAPAVPVAPAEYAALREELLAGTAHTAYTGQQLDFQRLLCPHPGSGLYRLELVHGPGCAAVENWPGAPVVKELLCAPEDMEQGGLACAALCGRSVQVRFPAGAADGQPFAAILWLEGAPPSCRGAARDGWMGLAFD